MTLDLVLANLGLTSDPAGRESFIALKLRW